MKNQLIETDYLRYFFGFSNVDLNINQSNTNHLINKFEQLKNGEYTNKTENKCITHHQLRSNESIDETENMLKA